MLFQFLIGSLEAVSERVRETVCQILFQFLIGSLEAPSLGGNLDAADYSFNSS